LDDGYQNQQLKKDYDILLLDARNPFGNFHCLPAGPLREKDYSRADIIILTHSDMVGEKKIISLKKRLREKSGKRQVFAGKHSFAGFVNIKGEYEKNNILHGKKCLVTAGIGSFSQFVESVEKENILISGTKKYPDHYCYVRSDIDGLLRGIAQKQYDVVITTRKDWQKIKPLLTKKELKEKIPLFIFDILFTFLSEEEKDQFFYYTNKVLQKKMIYKKE